ncbi:hypothetical protein, partial [Vibrio sp. 03_296]|uniref:hypothetical protein n=1 Tax=Vibrio sp. 03_296 TaxID=2024409 RepID=UPI002D7EFBEA
MTFKTTIIATCLLAAAPSSMAANGPNAHPSPSLKGLQAKNFVLPDNANLGETLCAWSFRNGNTSAFS